MRSLTGNLLNPVPNPVPQLTISNLNRNQQISSKIKILKNEIAKCSIFAINELEKLDS